MYRHRELLTSLLASAMLTASLVPTAGTGSQASVIDPAAAGRLLGAAFSRMPDGGWSMPGMDALPAVNAVNPVIAVSLSDQNGDGPIITREALKVRYDIALTNPTPATIGSNISVPLGLTQAGALETKQIGEKTATGHHLFAAPTTPIGKILIFLIKDGVVYLYACDMDGKLLAAGTYINKVFTPMTIEAATPGFNAELRHWNNAVVTPKLPTNA